MTADPATTVGPKAVNPSADADQFTSAEPATGLEARTGERPRLRVRVEGVVQGVGFRPFVHGLATGYRLSGFVGNDAAGVFLEAEGEPAALAGFLDDLQRRAPPLALVERVVSEPAPPTGATGFRIVRDAGSAGVERLASAAESASVARLARTALIPPDTATCEACLAELSDPADRRHRYAFTNCVDCGPRFTIVTDVPYDRQNTTMAAFPLCPDCDRERADPSDRRFHAEPVCCPACGPRLELLDAGGDPAPGDPMPTAVAWMRQGRILAIKGLGGYHLAALAADETAVATLRARKHREDKPFAVMVADLAAARALVDVEPAAEPILTGPRRPVTLLPRRSDAQVAVAVAPGNGCLGVMLPYTPMHHLLAAALGEAFVLTSGNVSDEPIACRDADALARLSGIADGFLRHDRRIHVRADDSVTRVFRGRELVVRRSRGHAPSPIASPVRFARHVLACGAELKNTFCLGKDRRAFVSHHIGDLENHETMRAFVEGVEHFRRLFDIRPEVVAHDLHPEYLSTKHALALDGVDLVAVQHHHAHVASCLADNGETGPVIGVAFDGLGFGLDGTLWGGELLVADLAGFERIGHLDATPMPGGAAAVRHPWRMAAAYLDAVFGDSAPDLDVRRRHERQWAPVVALARAGVNAPRTSSAGRLFDAVAAITGVRDSVTYEGQAAVELEQRVAPGERGGYPAGGRGAPPLAGVGFDLVRHVVDDVRARVDVGVIAARFHHGLAAAVVAAAVAAREATGLATVALSGGVFQNMVLLDRVTTGLEAAGLRVLTHRRVPPNDGGVSLGQAVIAAARDRAGAVG